MDSVTAFHLLVQEAPILLSFVTLMFIVGMSFHNKLMYASIVCFACLLFFFRNPTRRIELISNDKYAITAPADGKIVDIAYDDREGIEGYTYKISIAISVLDAHINRIPSAGIIKHIDYIVGYHGSIFTTKTPRVREHQDLLVSSSQGAYLMRQIAGTLARRVVCWVQEGDMCKTGQIYGMILFGSRFELYLPHNVRLCIGIGQHVKAGVTKIADWRR